MPRLSFTLLLRRARRLMRKKELKEVEVITGGGVDVEVGEEPPEGADEAAVVRVGDELEEVEVITGGVDVEVGEEPPEGEDEVAAVRVGDELPVGDAFLSMVYPPALYIVEREPDLIDGCVNLLCVHGLWETKNPPRRLDEQEFSWKWKKIEDIEFAPDVEARINSLMPQLLWPSLDHMKKEVTKHGSKIPFIKTPDAYATFTLDVYERYDFVNLYDFIAKKAAEEITVTRHKCLKVSWIGIKVKDLLAILHSYAPTIDGEFGLELLYRDTHYILYHVSFCVTSDMRPARRCKKQHEVVINHHPEWVVNRDLPVLMIEKNQDEQKEVEQEDGSDDQDDDSLSE